jgi:hypothetical protein
VNKANQTPYEFISGEDMLAKVEKYNREAEKIMQGQAVQDDDVQKDRWSQDLGQL